MALSEKLGEALRKGTGKENVEYLAFLVEVVRDGGVDGGELLKTSHPPEAWVHRPYQRKHGVGILDTEISARHEYAA